MVMDNFDNNDAKYQEVQLISCKQTYQQFSTLKVHYRMKLLTAFLMVSGGIRFSTWTHIRGLWSWYLVKLGCTLKSLLDSKS